ncbi:hypothetical protein N752_20190 [Desulforamulus aquiferis]|nr:hypothetical protein N752_20190 [Desulforamulus aquiferis]
MKINEPIKNNLKPKPYKIVPGEIFASEGKGGCRDGKKEK